MFKFGFDKIAISRSVYIKARANRLARRTQEELKWITSPAGLKEYAQHSQGKIPWRGVAVYSARHRAEHGLYRKQKFNVRKELNKSVPAGESGGTALRRKEHARWQRLSNQVNGKLNEHDLGIKEMARELPKTYKSAQNYYEGMQRKIKTRKGP